MAVLDHCFHVELKPGKMAFVERRKPEDPEKNPWSKDENQQQTQLTGDDRFRNRTRTIKVGGERSHFAPSVLHFLSRLSYTVVELQHKFFYNQLIKYHGNKHFLSFLNKNGGQESPLTHFIPIPLLKS